MYLKENYTSKKEPLLNALNLANVCKNNRYIYYKFNFISKALSKILKIIFLLIFFKSVYFYWSLQTF
jgi:hypothetical protein